MPSAWAGIGELIESVAGTPEIVAEAVDEVRATSREMASLDAADVAGHTRGLLVAATRAIAARRGPTEAELSFIEDLAVTRARQGIPIEAVLSAIHVAERRIWAAARELAAAQGVPAEDVLDARELYDDWAESVRMRLIVAHRRAEAGARRSGPDRAGLLLRRLLDGGSAAALGAAEAGLRPTAVTVLVAPEVTDAVGRDLVAMLRRRGVAGVDSGSVVGVVGAVTPELSEVLAEHAVGVAGPGPAEEAPALRRLAEAAAEVTAEVTVEHDRRGPTHATDVAVQIALGSRGDLGSALLERHRGSIAQLGRTAEATVRTVRTWIELGTDSERTADALFVHANTVRNRVGALAAATGLDARDPFDILTMWWVCRGWTSGTRERESRQTGSRVTRAPAADSGPVGPG